MALPDHDVGHGVSSKKFSTMGMAAPRVRGGVEGNRLVGVPVEDHSFLENAAAISDGGGRDAPTAPEAEKGGADKGGTAVAGGGGTASPSKSCTQCSQCVVSSNFFKTYCVDDNDDDDNCDEFCGNNCVKQSYMICCGLGVAEICEDALEVAKKKARTSTTSTTSTTVTPEEDTTTSTSTSTSTTTVTVTPEEDTST